MGSASHEIVQAWTQIGEAGDGVDGPLDALAGTEQSPREQARAAVGSLGGRTTGSKGSLTHAG